VNPKSHARIEMPLTERQMPTRRRISRRPGRPTTNTGSRPTEQNGPPIGVPPKAPVPDGHTVCLAETPSEQNNTRTLAVCMPDMNTNPVVASGHPERKAS
jgi:hypothetical protein